MRLQPIIPFTLIALISGCAAKAEPPAESGEGHAKQAAIDIAPDSPRLKFLKVEAVSDSGEPATVVLTGKVAFDEAHTQRIASPIDGRATRVLAEVGDDVAAGQVVLELSSPSIGQLQADVQKARQDVGLAKKTLDRDKGMLAIGSIAAKEVAQAETDYAKANADLSAVSARFASLNLALGHGAGIRAVGAGTVVDRSVLVGQEVRADQAQPLMTVSDLSTVWVIGDLFEQDLALVRPGSDVSVAVAAYPGTPFPGKVSVVGSVVDPATRAIKIRCVLPNADRRLKPEMFARITLRDADAQRITIPVKAVLSDTQPPHVVVVEGSRYKLREVSVGPEVAGRVRVLSGLEKGERIVTDGAIFLRQEIESQ